MKPIDFSEALHVVVSDLKLAEIQADCYVIEGDSLMQPVTEEARELLADIQVPDLLLEEGGVLQMQLSRYGGPLTVFMMRPGESLDAVYEDFIHFLNKSRHSCVAIELIGARRDVRERITALFGSVLKGVQEGNFVISSASLAPPDVARVQEAIIYYKCE